MITLNSTKVQERMLVCLHCTAMQYWPVKYIWHHGGWYSSNCHSWRGDHCMSHHSSAQPTSNQHSND